ncbi:putative glycolipid-binding domain-containing protein [Oerskovia sp. M15]
MTNSMPILRLGLVGGRAPPHRPFDDGLGRGPVPSCPAQRPDLRGASPYDPTAGRGVVRYTSATRGFTADLTVDEDGLVIDYPHLARRLR